MPASFRERIKLRYERWWGPPRPGGRTVRDAAHRLRERRALRSRDDPDEVWRCCDAWPRTLITKYNGREFAAKHGAAVPELHWWGTEPERAPLESLDGDFVVRPFTGAAREGVLVVAGGRDLLRDEPAAPDDVRARLRRRTRILLEARVRPEDPSRALPLEYKVHTFAGFVGAVEVIDRRDSTTAEHWYYTVAWERFDDPMNTRLPPLASAARPTGLDEMLDLAARIGAAIGTYMRIDFFAGDAGLVFNEFAATPSEGELFTPHANEMFGRLWAEHHGDAI